MRLLPQSLFGRLLLFLMGGLILAQLLSVTIQLQDRGRALYRSIGVNSAQRIAAIVHVLDRLPAGERRGLVSALDLPPTRISLDLPWGAGIGEDSRHAALFAAVLRRYLPGERPLRAEIAAADPTPSGGGATEPPPHRRAAEPARHERVLLVQVGLADGRVVTFHQFLPAEIFAWPHRLLLTLLILLLSVVALSVPVVRWLTRPLALLATAATELGRDIHRPALKETGPLEVRRAARAFNTMQTRLTRYIQDRSRILAAISHDLKTPITRLRLRAELLSEAELKEKFQADLDEMEAMVRATLDFMRGTEDSERVTPLDINALLESLQEDAEETGGDVAIEGTANMPFKGRPLALKRCLTNLMSNALDYGRRAVIRVYDTPEQLTLIVCDEGPGIPEAELERVFEPFYRLEGSRSRHTGGTGLGLGIARNIARAHGGELSLRNGKRTGLEAVLSLPR